MVSALTACASNKGLLEPESLYPRALTWCAEEPVVMERLDKAKPRPAVEKAMTLEDFRTSGQDCRETVASWAKRRELYLKQYEREKYNWFERVFRTATGSGRE